MLAIYIGHDHLVFELLLKVVYYLKFQDAKIHVVLELCKYTHVYHVHVLKIQISTRARYNYILVVLLIVFFMKNTNKQISLVNPPQVPH